MQRPLHSSRNGIDGSRIVESIVMPGPRPKPTVLKIAEKKARGTLDRPLGKNEPKPDVSIPKCPELIKGDPVAYKEWKRLSVELKRLGLITTIDLAALLCYCQAFSDLHRAVRRIKLEGSIITTATGAIKPHPAVGQKNESMKLLRQFIAEFGLSPAARARVSVGDKGKGEDEQAREKLTSRLLG